MYLHQTEDIDPEKETKEPENYIMFRTKHYEVVVLSIGYNLWCIFILKSCVYYLYREEWFVLW